MDDILLDIFFGLLAVAVIVALLLGLFCIADSAFLTLHDGQGMVINCDFQPGHTEEQFNAALKMTVPVWVADQWVLTIGALETHDTITIDHVPYAWQGLGHVVNIRYGFGRITHDLTIKEISQPIVCLKAGDCLLTPLGKRP